MIHLTFILEDISIVAVMNNANDVQLSVCNASENAAKTVQTDSSAFAAAMALAIASDEMVGSAELYELAEPLMAALAVKDKPHALRFIP